MPDFENKKAIVLGGTSGIGLAATEMLRDAGAGRLVVPAGELPVRQDRHRGYHDSDPAYRDKQSRRTYDRFLQRFRGREDLRLPR